MKATIRIALLLAVVACTSTELPSAPQARPTELRVPADSLIVNVEEGDIYDVINACHPSVDSRAVRVASCVASFARAN